MSQHKILQLLPGAPNGGYFQEITVEYEPEGDRLPSIYQSIVADCFCIVLHWPDTGVQLLGDDEAIYKAKHFLLKRPSDGLPIFGPCAFWQFDGREDLNAPNPFTQAKLLKFFRALPTWHEIRREP